MDGVRESFTPPDLAGLLAITAATLLMISAAAWLNPDFRCRPGDTRTTNHTDLCARGR